MPTVDLALTSLRDLNQMLHALREGTNETDWLVLNPKGQHAVAVGIDAPVRVEIKGSVGYYCACMNKQATVLVDGSAGPSGLSAEVTASSATRCSPTAGWGSTC